jgi:hypothetical protein
MPSSKLPNFWGDLVEDIYKTHKANDHITFIGGHHWQLEGYCIGNIDFVDIDNIVLY